MCKASYQAQQNPQNAPLNLLLEQIPPPVLEKMTKLFRTAYHIAKTGRPFEEYESLVEIQNLNGANLGDTYNNRNSCKDFLKAINDISDEDMRKTLHEASMFSILIDGSTDSSMYNFDMK